MLQFENMKKLIRGDQAFESAILIDYGHGGSVLANGLPGCFFLIDARQYHGVFLIHDVFHMRGIR